MDLSAFNSDKFDVTSWVNNALSSSSLAPDQTIESHVQSLLLKMQVTSVDLSNSLEDAATTAANTIPRVVREAERIEKESQLLKKHIYEIQQRASDIERNATDTVSDLAAVDRVKSVMANCMTVLEEVQVMSKITRGIERVFVSQDISSIGEELASMGRSLKAIKHLPDFSHSEHDLEKFQERLLNLLVPKFKEALQSRDSGTVRHLVQVARKVDKSDVIYDAYCESREKTIVDLWEKYTTSQDFAEWLKTEFFEDLMGFLKTESEWTTTAIPTSLQEAGAMSLLPSLLCRSLQSITEEFEKRLEKYVEMKTKRDEADTISSPESPTSLLTELYNLTLASAKKIRGILAGDDAKLLDDTVWLIIKPFAKFQRDAAIYEKGYIQSELSAFKLKASDVGETIQNIELSISKFFGLLEATVDRCIRFTEGSEANAIVEICGDMLTAFLQRIFQLLGHLRTLSGVEPTSTATNKSSIDEPAFIEGSLRFLDLSHHLKGKITAFDATLRASLSGQRFNLFGTTVDSPDGVIPCLHLRHAPTEHQEQLKELLAKLNEVHYQALPRPLSLSLSLVSSAQKYAYDVLFNPVKQQFEAMLQLPVWATEAEETAYKLPTFSLSPLEYVTQVGEYLLNLPQQFEYFASNESMSLQGSDLFRKEISGEPPSGGDTSKDGEGADGADDEEGDEVVFTNQWLRAIAYGAVDLYVSKVLEIPKLSELGGRQLAEDMDYLVNILFALGVEAGTSLMALKEVITMEAAKIQSPDVEKGVEAGTLRTIAKMREIELT